MGMGGRSVTRRPGEPTVGPERSGRDGYSHPQPKDTRGRFSIRQRPPDNILHCGGNTKPGIQDRVGRLHMHVQPRSDTNTARSKDRTDEA